MKEEEEPVILVAADAVSGIRDRAICFLLRNGEIQHCLYFSKSNRLSCNGCSIQAFFSHTMDKSNVLYTAWKGFLEDNGIEAIKKFSRIRVLEE